MVRPIPAAPTPAPMVDVPRTFSDAYRSALPQLLALLGTVDAWEAIHFHKEELRKRGIA